MGSSRLMITFIVVAMLAISSDLFSGICYFLWYIYVVFNIDSAMYIQIRNFFV